MKKFLLLLPLLAITVNSFNQVESKANTETLKWYSWNEGYVKAKADNKILLVDIYTDWCGWCKKMDRDTYAKQEVIDVLNKHFIVVKFNPEIRNVVYDVDGTKLSPGQLYSNLVQGQSTGYPTTVFLFTKEKRVYLQAGYQNAENFIKLLNQYVALK